MKAIIFDLDGVICSTDDYHYKAWKAMADDMGIEFNRTINNRLRGVSRMESLDIILEKYNGTLTEEEKISLATKKNTIYRELLNNMSEGDVTEDVRNTLNKLRDAGVMLAIGSSSKNARFILDKIGLGDFFDKISDGNNIKNSKPDPEVFLKAAEYLGLTAIDCLVVEDAYAGVDAAIRGGFQCAAISDAYNYDKATYHIKNFSELLRIFNIN